MMDGKLNCVQLKVHRKMMDGGTAFSLNSIEIQGELCATSVDQTWSRCTKVYHSLNRSTRVDKIASQLTLVSYISSQCTIVHDISSPQINNNFVYIRTAGLEPARLAPQGLNLACLPVPLCPLNILSNSWYLFLR